MTVSTENLKQYIAAASPAIQREFVDYARVAYKEGASVEASHSALSGMETYISDRLARRERGAERLYPYPKIEQPRLYRSKAEHLTGISFRVIADTLQQGNADANFWYDSAAIYLEDREGINDLFDRPTEMVDAS